MTDPKPDDIKVNLIPCLNGILEMEIRGDKKASFYFSAQTAHALGVQLVTSASVLKYILALREEGSND